MTWTLRRATAADLDAIMALERGTFPTDAWSEESMRAELASPDTFYLVGESAGVVEPEVEGYGGLKAPRGAEQGDIQTIAVAEHVRRRGLGRAILASLLAEAAARGVRELFLEVRADNPVAEALYVAHGFERIATRPRYYQPDGVDALVMRLRFPPAPEAAE